MKTRSIPFIILALFLCTAASSQQGLMKLNLNYSVGLPTGNLKNLTNDVSGRGWSGALLYGITDQISVGVEAGFQDFYQKNERQLYHENGSDISAVISNSVQAIPILVKAKYRFTQGGLVQPFAAVGVGGSYVRYRKFYGQFAEGDSKFGFAAQPELGLQIPVGRMKAADIHLSAGYNFMPFTYNDAHGVHHAFVKAGVGIPLRR